MVSDGKLEGKVVMVTGASSGIGRDLCPDLARAGCRVVAAARRADRLKTLCEEITAFRSGNGAVAAAVLLDVSAEEAVVAGAVRRAWDAFGRIDGLVNNAGIRGGVHASVDWSKEEWDDVIRTNLTGTWLVSKHVCRLMRDAKIKGSVINVSSIVGLPRSRSPGAIAYDASKTAVHALTQAMALDVGAYNIRVNAIAPGLFKSEITASLMSKPWLSGVIEKIVPLRTLGTTDPAITMLVQYLLQDSSDYISGNVFIVDAGTTLPGVPIFSSL
ncbi:3-oxoacyl-[acyl-carrier-protein] reductase, chloroplastic-like [Curcuma longa]|uniref:3-oxoacyl-[acyl-carrier-protein] reductase, chloroplastic-like n=1 Tax=Curcuma longa TaxID=136217 RepID=UPI003D9EE65C